MKSKLLLSLVAALAGIGLGKLVCYSVVGRDAIGQLCGKGHLLVLAQGCGIYQTDFDLALAEFQNVRGEDELVDKDEAQRKHTILSLLTVNAIARNLATNEKISVSEVDREFHLWQWQFRDGSTWKKALLENNLSERSLRSALGQDLRTRRWIERQIASGLEVTAPECEQFFQNHQELYFQPVRLRANHLFLAAPSETPPEVIDLKRDMIASLSDRISQGEKFSDLVESVSEDEATKMRGGDLGFFAAYRMPSDFFAAAAKLRPGQLSQPIRTSLGFHLIQLTDLKPARQMTLPEAYREILASFEREKRHLAVQKLEDDLGAKAQVIRSFF